MINDVRSACVHQRVEETPNDKPNKQTKEIYVKHFVNNCLYK